MKKIFFAILFVVVMVAGCVTGGSIAGLVSLEKAYGKVFILSNMHENMKISIVFEKNRVYGFSGVNRYSGAYSMKDGKITFSNMTSTMMAGPEDAMKAEQDYIIQLNSGGVVSFDGSVLKIGELTFKAKN